MLGCNQVVSGSSDRNARLWEGIEVKLDAADRVTCLQSYIIDCTECKFLEGFIFSTVSFGTGHQQTLSSFP